MGFPINLFFQISGFQIASDVFLFSFKTKTQWAKSPKKQSLTIWHCILSAELTKNASYDCFFGDFAHWEGRTS